MAQDEFDSRVFINCPLDAQYKPIFEAIVFAVLDCGLDPSCALEIDDASEVRIDKIFNIIAECKYGIHDISRTEAAPATGLPRFNMPLELGMFLAAKRFGVGKQKRKVCLILDSTPYRYQQFISDIAGQDIQIHNNSVGEAITAVRNWLRNATRLTALPGGNGNLPPVPTLRTRASGPLPGTQAATPGAYIQRRSFPHHRLASREELMRGRRKM